MSLQFVDEKLYNFGILSLKSLNLRSFEHMTTIRGILICALCFRNPYLINELILIQFELHHLGGMDEYKIPMMMIHQS
jgi:hypothetical protein